jgi:hypothetical protein
MPTKLETLQEYLNLITSEHNHQPRYMATVALSLSPFVDSQLAACSIIGGYDLDTAVGQQLDFTGQWIGLTRFLSLPIDIWFSFDIPGLGFDQGRWMVPWEDQFQIIRLDDEDYRTLLKARVMANYWDGTIPGAYRAWDRLFGPRDYHLLIQDQLTRGVPNIHGNMNIWQILLGPPISPVVKMMFSSGLLGLKSAGVGTGYRIIQSQPGDGGIDGTGYPIFAFDTDPATAGKPYPEALLAGFDEGAWGEVLPELPGFTPEVHSIWDNGASIWDDNSSHWDVAIPTP